MQDAIRGARDKGVLVFAATGNSGLNAKIRWPASSTGSGVISIGATDSYGRVARFNSGSAQHLHTFGVGVASCAQDAQHNTIYRSGTSFATPIAVATAAIVFDFVECWVASLGSEEDALPDDFTDVRKRLHTAAGMEAILRKMCVSHDSSLAYIAPWFFCREKQWLRIHTIVNCLRGVQESGVEFKRPQA